MSKYVYFDLCPGMFCHYQKCVTLNFSIVFDSLTVFEVASSSNIDIETRSIIWTAGVIEMCYIISHMVKSLDWSVTFPCAKQRLQKPKSLKSLLTSVPIVLLHLCFTRSLTYSHSRVLLDTWTLFCIGRLFQTTWGTFYVNKLFFASSILREFFRL